MCTDEWMLMKPRLQWWERLNKALFPYMGPAQVGPYETEPLPPVDDKACPICGQPMREHIIERSAGQLTATRLHCPATDRAAA